MKIGVGLDFDNVLMPFNQAALNGQCQLSSCDLSRHYGSEEECIRKLNEFYESDAFRNMRPYSGAVPFVRALTEVFKVPIVTSRPKKATEAVTLEQVHRFFPTVSEVYFANKNNNIGSLAKEEYCLRDNIKGFVDDDLSVCIAAFEVGILPVVFEQKWNADVPKEDGTPIFYREKDYKRIFTFFAKAL